MTTLIVLLVLVVVVVVAILGVVVTRRRSRSPLPPSPPVTPPRSLADRLAKTREALTGRIGGMVRGGRLDDGFFAAVEEALIAADVGVEGASAVVADLRAARPADAAGATHALQAALVARFAARDRSLPAPGGPAVLVVVGVNGSGKTTTIAKLAAHYQSRGAGVVLGGADTFRAAAAAPLGIWAGRVGVDLVTGELGADPASVGFDAYRRAKASGAGVVIVDTAGRLHSDRNLMNELSKITRVLAREAGQVDEVLLVVDGTVGQNAIAQAETFTAAVGVTGIAITKLDGTARGGIAVAIEERLGIPIKLIGVGEGPDDLVPFDPAAFVEALVAPAATIA